MPIVLRALATVSWLTVTFAWWACRGQTSPSCTRFRAPRPPSDLAREPRSWLTGGTALFWVCYREFSFSA